MDEEQQRLLDDLMSKGELAMRDRGLSDAQIADKKRELRRMIEQSPPDAAQWEQLARIDGGEPPQEVIPQVFGGGPTIWLAEHRLVFYSLFGVLAGVLGYFGALGGTTPQRVSPGISGLLFGVLSVVVVAVVVEVWFKLRGPRRR